MILQFFCLQEVRSSTQILKKNQHHKIHVSTLVPHLINKKTMVTIINAEIVSDPCSIWNYGGRTCWYYLPVLP